MNISPARLTSLLQRDPGYIVGFIAATNPNDVADRMADLGFNRPVGMEGMRTITQLLLDAGREADFVHVYSVPVDLGGLNTDQATAVYQAVGLGNTPDTLGHALAQNALNAWKAADHNGGAELITHIPEPTAVREPTPTPEARKGKLMGTVISGLLVLALVVTIAVGVKTLIKS